ncbi:hypothetical protein HAX54_003658, partial [Datura stramonium]|nr:hypothetical protein [Datura stramonium]
VDWMQGEEDQGMIGAKPAERRHKSARRHPSAGDEQNKGRVESMFGEPIGKSPLPIREPLESHGDTPDMFGESPVETWVRSRGCLYPAYCFMMVAHRCFADHYLCFVDVPP